MPMSGTTFASKILAGFTAAGFVGISTPQFAAAIGEGSMLQILGKGYDTFDTWSQTGGGVGSGTGLTGIVGSNISLDIQTQIVSFTGLPPTPDMISMADAIGDAFEQETTLATLETTHSPAALGTAIIIVGSIQVSGSEIGGSIETFGNGVGFLGKDWPNFANIFGSALANALLLASGDIVITGGGSSGSGSAPNAISPAGVLA